MWSLACRFDLRFGTEKVRNDKYPYVAHLPGSCQEVVSFAKYRASRASTSRSMVSLDDQRSSQAYY
jgi:hypothetical protein